MEASITFKSVAKVVNNNTLLAELTFGVEKNTTFVLVGPNGSGKTAILKLICGIINKDKGSIYIKGYDIDVKSHEIKSIIGYMPQKNDIDNELKIIDNICIYAQLHGLSEKQSKEKCLLIADKLNFTDYLYSYPEDLSYGILRLVLFSRAIIHDPEILILDEPTSNLDPIYRELIWDYINEINHNKTIFYTTQNFYEAQEHSDRIAILYDGSIKFNGTFEYLVKNTFGLARFMISYNKEIPEEIKKNISLNPKIIKPTMLNNKLKFYSTNKSEFFKILKDSILNDVNDIDSAKCSLEDIFRGIEPGDID